MKQIDEIYQYILEKCLRQAADGEKNAEPGGTTAAEIEEVFHIVRNNASTLLNQLAAQGRLVKLSGRPVRFITVQENTPIDTKQNYQKETAIRAKDPFAKLIGCKDSLSVCIVQAKAAMIYPPNGLHTLLLGESGVGKSLFAHTMYEYARDMLEKDENEFPFVAFNCADYYNNSQLLYAHLFGHVKGAFTGASDAKQGLVEAADGGILFLDEVHRLPPNGQEMLFSLIDKGEFFRLGESKKPRKSNVLIIAATTEDPEKILLSTFLRRIAVTIVLPSIDQRGEKERRELIRYLFEEESKKIGLTITVSSQVEQYLLTYPCPGNIGQLKSDIRQICSRAFLQKGKIGEYLDIGIEFLPQQRREPKYRKEQKVEPKAEKDIIPGGKKDMILVICSSGVGSGRMFLEAIQTLLQEYYIDMEVAVLPYQDVVRQSETYDALVSQYRIIAGIGNMNPGLDMPYFDITEVLSNRRDNAFKSFLSAFDVEEEEMDGFKQAYYLLEDTTLALNPKQAVKHIREFLRQVWGDEDSISKDGVVKCVTHMGYMLERLITGLYIKHDYKEELMAEYKSLIGRLRDKSKIFTDIYHIQVTDDELCFLADLMEKLEIGGSMDDRN